MTRRIIIRVGFPYYGTDVPFERSLEQIKTMLRKHGCHKIAEMTDGDAARIVFEKDGRIYLIDFPLAYIETGSKYQRKTEPAMRISGRIIHDRIKALLVGVEVQYMEFHQAMIGFLAIQGPEGRPVALMDRIDDLKGKVDQLFLPAPGA